MNNRIKDEVVSFIDASKAADKKARARPWFWVILACGALLIAAIIVFATSPKAPSTEPGGKITQPQTGSRSPRTIVIFGQTENIPPDRPFVIMAVDRKDKGLCWPKKPIIKPNTRFRISFEEGGPAGPVKVSLYAVNHDLHDKIKQWFKEERLGGMPIFPDRYRLDSVALEVY